MAKLTLGHQLKVEWEKIYLDAQRALSYLEENKTRPVKSAHKILAANVKKSALKITKLSSAPAGNGA